MFGCGVKGERYSTLQDSYKDQGEGHPSIKVTQ